MSTVKLISPKLVIGKQEKSVGLQLDIRIFKDFFEPSFLYQIVQFMISLLYKNDLDNEHQSPCQVPYLFKRINSL